MPTRQPAQLDPDDYKNEEFEDRAAYDVDPGAEQDPLPHHPHREHKPGDEIDEAELAGDDLAERAEDDLMNADGPVG